MPQEPRPCSADYEGIKWLRPLQNHQMPTLLRTSVSDVSLPQGGQVSFNVVVSVSVTGWVMGMSGCKVAAVAATRKKKKNEDANRKEEMLPVVQTDGRAVRLRCPPSRWAIILVTRLATENKRLPRHAAPRRDLSGDSFCTCTTCAPDG